MTRAIRTVSLVALNLLAFLVASSGGPLPFEVQVTRSIGEGPGSDRSRAWGEWLTDLTAPMVFVAVVIFIGWRFGRAAATTAVVAGLATVVVRFVDLAPRPRPTAGWQWAEPIPGWGGYPSGHVVFIAVLAGVGVHAVRQDSTESGRGQRQEVPTGGWELAVVTVAAVVVGWTRVAAGLHWAFDVVGGWLLATLIVHVSGDWVLPAVNRWVDRLPPRLRRSRAR